MGSAQPKGRYCTWLKFSRMTAMYMLTMTRNVMTRYDTRYAIANGGPTYTSETQCKTTHKELNPTVIRPLDVVSNCFLSLTVDFDNHGNRPT